MEIATSDKAFLVDQIRHGNAILFLGAGANEGAKNGAGQPIKDGDSLVLALREKVHSDDIELGLGDLIEELTLQFGEAGLNKFLRAEFADCTSSTQQANLLKYAWLRIYTLNIDDAIDHVPRVARAQQFVQVNRSDPVEEQRTFDCVEIVHLNGYINNMGCGFVFTPSQYRAEIRHSSTWYAKCAQDFFDKTFIFIGTKLNEPIFEAHVEEISRNRGQYSARSFFLSPEPISNIRSRRLLAKRIEPVIATLSSFIDFLHVELGDSLRPNEIAAYVSGQPNREGAPSALVASVEQIGTTEWFSKRRLGETGQRRVARDFFNGSSPTWDVVTNNISVELSQDRLITARLKDFLLSTSVLYIVTGQSGSGKTTSLMKATLDIARTAQFKIFVLDESTREPINKVVRYLSDSFEGEDVILLVNNIVLFADELPEIEASSRGGNVKIVAQSRSRDWEGRISRYAPRGTVTVDIPKLDERDFEELRKGIIDHAVAPEFIKLKDKTKQIAFLRSSKQQLLVLMKEATHQRRFEEIIEDEFRSIESDAGRAAFCIVGLATLAKNQLSVGELSEMMTLMNPALDVNEALRQLEGVVIKGAGGLVGRHEIYVRHVFDVMIESQLLKDVIVGTLKYFTRFGQPVIPKLGRQRGNLFKFLLNSDWLYETFYRKGDLKMAERVYSSIEIEYQLDGHYWLQRGLFYRRRRVHKVAQDCLDKSVGAYPNNLFAQHARAQQQLINAAIAGRGSVQLEREVHMAVKELNRQSQLRDPTDEYPLVTLSRYHPEVLLKWGDLEGARALAREYFERLSALRKALPRSDRAVEAAWASCMELATTGQWTGPKY
jgi:tetratricopeptide (TPR) repeat protein